MIHNSEQASAGWLDFPRLMQSAEVAKLSPEACWLVVGEEGAVEWGGGGQKHSMWGFLQSPEPFEWVPHEYSGITAVA